MPDERIPHYMRQLLVNSVFWFRKQDMYPYFIHTDECHGRAQDVRITFFVNVLFAFALFLVVVLCLSWASL